MAKGETDLCRNRLLKYCNGQGLDLGCGNVKIKPEAIGIDLLSPIADMNADARIMPYYPNNHFDYIYSSHLLEEIGDVEGTLKEWLRIIKDGGYIVLYQPDKDFYYPLGDERCNPNHLHHFGWEDLWAIFQKIGGVELIHHARYPQKPFEEWSFELVVIKGKKPAEKLEEPEGISILIPTLNRPDNIERFCLAVDGTTTNKDKTEILFGIHTEDTKSREKIEELSKRLKTQIRYEFIERFADSKIHLSFLWNQLYKKSKYPIVGYFGDDVVFKTIGWDIEVRKEFQKDKAILFSCNDVHCQMGAIATLFFTHKIAHEKIGFYLNMNFRRWFMDTFWDCVYRNAGKLIYRPDVITEHIHPDKFPHVADEVYNNMENFKNDDRKTWDSSENKTHMLSCIEILKTIK